VAVNRAVQAQFGASMGPILRPVDRIRVTRHEAEYPGQATYIDDQSVLAACPLRAGLFARCMHRIRAVRIALAVPV
jgi:hypothetical protein